MSGQDDRVDLRGMPYIPLHIERLRRSKAWLICKRRPDLAFYMLNLWMASWHEVPCGSMEDDDDVLADAAMCEPKKWKALKADIMRGWTLGEDGRLHHPVVEELALDTWEKRVKWREKKRGQRGGQADLSPDASPGDTQVDDAGTSAMSPRDNRVKGREGKGRERETAQSRGTRIPDDWRPTEADEAWAEAECPTVNRKRQAQRFQLYWSAKAGKDATKLDWSATWRNWLLKEAELAPRVVDRTPGNGAFNFTDPITDRDREEAAEHQRRIAKAALSAS